MDWHGHWQKEHVGLSMLRSVGVRLLDYGYLLADSSSSSLD
jgi:hypothetical protein